MITRHYTTTPPSLNSTVTIPAQTLRDILSLLRSYHISCRCRIASMDSIELIETAEKIESTIEKLEKNLRQ